MHNSRDAPIKVLVADDTDIAREGLRRILQASPGIEVVGQAATIRQALLKTSELGPDVVIMDLKWFGDEHAGIFAIREIKRSHPKVKVIAFTLYGHLIEHARSAGADSALPKEIRSELLLNEIRYLISDFKKSSSAYVQELAGVKPGRADARAYEELMYEILNFLLGQSLSNPRFQSRTWLGTRVRDIVFFNGSNHPFWQSIRTQHGSEHIVFELKNTAKIEPEHVDQLGSYLGRSLGHFGILIGRCAPAESVWLRQVALYNNEGKVILAMWDEHTRTMLSLKAAGIDPAEVIQDLYVEFKQRVQ